MRPHRLFLIFVSSQWTGFFSVGNQITYADWLDHIHMICPQSWPGLNVGPIVWAQTRVLTWLQKFGWPQFWPQKKSLASNLKLFFSSSFSNC